MYFLKSINTFVFIIAFANVFADFYDYDVVNAEGNLVSLSQYKGQVTLIVNVASECGFTDSTYRALTRLHDILSYGNYFSVLAFPCNQFGDQEPDDVDVIVMNMTSTYGVEFPIYNKINIIGESASPAFKNLIDQSSLVPDWNFYKYLVGPDGKVISAWSTRTSIEDIFEIIHNAVKETRSNLEDSKNTLSKDEL